MAELVIFNNIKDWYPPVICKHKYLTVPRISIDLRAPYSKDIGEKQQKIVAKQFAAIFDGKFASLSKVEFGKVQLTIDMIETLIEGVKTGKIKKPLTKEALEKTVANCNAQLKAAVDAWKKKVEDLASDCFGKAVEKSDAEMKQKIKRSKVKAICIAAVVAAIAITAIALTIVTAGAGAALAVAIAGAVIAGLAVVHKLGEGVKTAWGLCQDKMKEIKTELVKIEKARAAVVKLAPDIKGDLSLAEKAKKMKNEVIAGSSNLGKLVGQLEKYRRDFVVKLDTAQGKVKELENKLKEAKDDARVALLGEEIKVLNTRVDDLKKRIKDVDDVVGLGNEAVNSLKALQMPQYPRLAKLLDAAGQIGNVVTGIVGDIKTIASNAEKVKKAA